MFDEYDIVCVLGPTASGKTRYAVDLARVICDMIATERYGIYHVRNEGYMSWADFAAMIMEMILNLFASALAFIRAGVFFGFSTFAPHSPQNSALSGRTVPHLLQIISPVLSVPMIITNTLYFFQFAFVFAL